MIAFDDTSATGTIPLGPVKDTWTFTVWVVVDDSNSTAGTKIILEGGSIDVIPYKDPPRLGTIDFSYYEKALRALRSKRQREANLNIFGSFTDTRIPKSAFRRISRTGRRTRESRNRAAVRQLSLSGVH